MFLVMIYMKGVEKNSYLLKQSQLNDYRSINRKRANLNLGCHPDVSLVQMRRSVYTPAVMHSFVADG